MKANKYVMSNGIIRIFSLAEASQRNMIKLKRYYDFFAMLL